MSRYADIDWSNPVSDDPLNRDFVSWWLAGPGPRWGGPKFYDLVRASSRGGGNHGVLTNGPTWRGAAGRPGGRGILSFDGTDDYVSCGDIATTISDLTICFWFRSSSTDQGMIVGKYDNTPASAYMVWRLSGNSSLRFYRATNSTVTATETTTSMSDGLWRHYCAAWVGGTAYVYVNGKQENTESIGGTPSSGAGIDFRIGRDVGASLGDAVFDIDDVRLFSRALSAVEVMALHYDSHQDYPRTLRRRRGSVDWVDTGDGGGGFFGHHYYYSQGAV